MAEELGAYPDLVAALGALQEVPKAGKVAAGQRQYRFMTLPDLLTEIRRVFTEHHLGFMQDVTIADGHVVVTTIVVHASGHEWRYGPLAIRAQADAQSIGSAITYARRYAAAALVGLAGDDDDDGQASQVHTSPRNSKETQAAEYQQTRPVTRAPKRADDPADAPWQLPPTPVSVGELGDVTSPSNTTVASKKSQGMMWGLKRNTPMTDDEFRVWVAKLLNLDSADWHTADLTQAQVSAVINRLSEAPQMGPDRRGPGQ